MTLDFFKQKYGHEIDGMWMPRVTAITSVFSRTFVFPGIMSYAEWGTAVHEAAEDILRGKAPNVEARIAPCVEAFHHWLSHNPIRVADERDIERRVFDRERGYAGTIDVAGEVGGQKGIIDIKTGAEFRKEHALQTAAYLHAYNQGRQKGQGETRWILRIDQYEECLGCQAKRRQKAAKAVVAGGKAACNHQWGEVRGEVQLEELPDFEQDLEAFFSAKEVWEWYNRDWLKRIPNYPSRILLPE